MTQVAQPYLLIVDDDRTSQILLQHLANHFEFRCSVAESCDEALLSYKSGEQYTHILMDIRLPGKDGLACTQLLRDIQREQGRFVPIIAVTAAALPGDRQKCMEAGMDDYLSKPFLIGQLLDMLARWSEPLSPAARAST